MKTYTADASLIRGRNTTGPAPLRERIRYILRGLQTAAGVYGLRERHLSVLEMLGSFLHELDQNGRPVIFASNKAMSQRARGMDIQRIQRVMRDLVERGLVLRRSSPNGKRYVRRDSEGQIRSAFGIDISPLFDREQEFREAAEQAAARDLHRRMLRDRLSLTRMEFTPESPEDIRIRALLRRRGASVEELEALLRDLGQDEAESTALPSGAASQPCPEVTPNPDQDDPEPHPARPEMTPNAHQFDMHHQTPIQKKIDKREGAPGPGKAQPKPQDDMPDCRELAAACPGAMEFTPESPRNWNEMLMLAETLAPMIGIGRSLAAKAYERLGPISFSAAIICLVERYGQIRNPAGYLTRLSESGSGFSPSRFMSATAARRALPS